MKYLIAILGVLAALCVRASAQSVPTGFISVSSSRLTNQNAVLIPSANVCAQATSNALPVSVHIGGGGNTTISRVCTRATNGAWSMNLPDGASSRPVNQTYTVTATDSVSGAALLVGLNTVQPHSQTCSRVGAGISCVANSVADWCQLSGCNFDNYVANTAALATVSAGPDGKQGPPGCVLGTTCTSALSPASVANVIYVYPGATDLGTLINNAFASCAGKPCLVEIAPQNFTVSYATTIHFPAGYGAVLEGNNVNLQYTGGGDGLVVDAFNANDISGEIRHITFDETGQTVLTNVIHQFPRGGMHYTKVTVRNAITSNALLLDNAPVFGTATNSWPLGATVPGYNERTVIDISSTHNAKGVVMRLNGGTNSFARTTIFAECHQDGPTEACVSAQNGAFVYGSHIVTHGNTEYAGARFIESITGSGIRADGFAEGEGNGYGFYVDSSSTIYFTGANQFLTVQGDFNPGPSSRLGVPGPNYPCQQAGYFQLGLPQERNAKWCESFGIEDLFTVKLGAERRGSLTVHQRTTSSSDPEANTTAGRDTIFQADATGTKVGPGFEDGHASISGADLTVHGVTGVESNTGLNSTTYATQTIDEVNHRFLTRHYGGTFSGQPSIPEVDQWWDFSTVFAWVDGETTSANLGVVNKSLTGNYDAKSFSAGNTPGWTGNCPAGHAFVVKNGIVTGCS